MVVTVLNQWSCSPLDTSSEIAHGVPCLLRHFCIYKAYKQTFWMRQSTSLKGQIVSNIFKRCDRWFSSKHDLQTFLFSFSQKCWCIIVSCYSMDSDKGLLFYLLEHGIHWGKYTFYFYQHHSHKRHGSDLESTW